VILAIPFSILRTLDFNRAQFDRLKILEITQLGYGTTAKLHLQFSQRFWERSGPWGTSSGSSYSDVGYQCTWDATRAQPGPTGVLAGLVGGSEVARFGMETAIATTMSSSSVATHAQRLLSQVERVFPGARAHYTGVASLSCPNADPNFRASYPVWLVGQHTSCAGLEKVRQGNIHFAGEHCSTAWQGYMEGAAQEGERAAGEILADLGIKPRA